MKPKLSVVIATYNEEKFLPVLLDRLDKQTLPKKDFEVLFYDGKSTDKTVSLLKKHKTQLNIRVSTNPKKRQVYAFNSGMNDARGKYFCLIGAHSEIPTDYLEQLLTSIQRVQKKHAKIAAVGGRADNIGVTRFGKIVAKLYTSPFTGSGSYRYATQEGFTQAPFFAIYDTKIAQEVGGFDEDFITGQDYELSQRLLAHGYQLWQNPKIITKHVMRSSLRKYIIQNFRYATAKGMCIRKGYAKPFRKALYALIIFLVVMAFLPWYVFAVFVALYILATVVASLQQRTLNLIWLLPLSHAISVLGVFKGLIRYKNSFDHLR